MSRFGRVKECLAVAWRKLRWSLWWVRAAGRAGMGFPVQEKTTNPKWQTITKEVQMADGSTCVMVFSSPGPVDPRFCFALRDDVLRETGEHLRSLGAALVPPDK